MRKPLRIIAGAASVAAIAWPAAASPTFAAGGDFGPNTCINGFVWRNAFPGDLVCVTPSTRDQAAADNRAAASRRDPNGAFGPSSCQSPFVWRAARPSDLVCVPVGTRTRTAADNATAASRRDSVILTLSRWTTSSPTNCSGDTCSTTNDSKTNHLVVVTNLNVGTAFLGLYRSSDGRQIQAWNVTSSPVPSGPGGRVAFKTNRLACSGAPNAYFRVKDPTSGRWSDRKYVSTGCRAL